MPLQCIVLSDPICSQHAIELILVSQNTRLEFNSNDSRIMCILCKTKKLSILFTLLSECEQSIVSVDPAFNFEIIYPHRFAIKLAPICERVKTLITLTRVGRGYST